MTDEGDLPASVAVSGVSGERHGDGTFYERLARMPKGQRDTAWSWQLAPHGPPRPRAAQAVPLQWTLSRRAARLAG